MTLSQRIAKLESKLARNGGIRIIVLLENETHANALVRHGLQPDARGIVFATPLDVDI